MIYLLLLLLAGCVHLQDTTVATLSAKKQRQKIASLQKKLNIAEKEQRAAQSEVDKLLIEIEEAQVALIRRQIDDYEKRAEKQFPIFLEEREALYQIIQAGPGPAAFQAQAELDRILRLITDRSEE
jgi:t-SNARE complex subunit (syntaxin)